VAVAVARTRAREVTRGVRLQRPVCVISTDTVRA
jgi:hypothetical protein